MELNNNFMAASEQVLLCRRRCWKPFENDTIAAGRGRHKNKKKLEDAYGDLKSLIGGREKKN